MYSFFVLGQIPGTGFQIDFQVWLAVVWLLATVLGLRYHFRNQVLPTRRPLPASQLHPRG